MKFVATPRSSADHAQLRQRLFTCRCDCRLPHIHRLHCPPPPGLTAQDIFEWTLFTLCQTLRVLIDRFNAKLYDRKRRWPSSLEDVFPCGQSSLLDSLMAWAADGASGFAVFSLIASVASTPTNFKQDVFRTPRVFALATAHLEAALDRYPTEHVSARVLPRFQATLSSCVADFFSTFGIGNPPAAKIMLHSILERQYAIALRMQAYLEPGREGMTGLCRAWFDLVCSRMGATFVPRGVAPPLPDYSRGMLATVWGAIVGMRSAKCTYAGCQLFARPTSSKVCARCGVARYCSPEHQASAWKAEEFPHRRVCKLLETLRAAIHMEDSKEWNSLIYDPEAGRSSREFLGRCHENNVNPALGKDIMVALGMIRGSFAR
ncbi:hypothetical protein B0H15DRAFT_472719 [Mycena belliarum]|uniref:MYND-type domain-containing protein n=1 Tax=Mycena belliarum TaxID=1033014 RepID=A0AAD6TXU3_9AGAR|nr:hypothetical protein B0H15DRAFT_472719 [Mycena belliae]